MENIKMIEKLSKKYSLSLSDFIKKGSSLAIKEKKRELKIEELEILARYSTKNIDELRTKIEEGIVPEHPAWEDYIELKNIKADIEELDSDIRTLQEA